MITTVMCKFRCGDIYYREDVQGNKTQMQVALYPVTHSPQHPEHMAYAKYTPGGKLELTIDNPNCFGFFKLGKTYSLPITEDAE